MLPLATPLVVQLLKSVFMASPQEDNTVFGAEVSVAAQTFHLKSKVAYGYKHSCKVSRNQI